MKALWICMDIVGTYGNIKENENKKKKLFEYFDQMRIAYEQDIVLFSFISTDNIETVETYTQEVGEIIQNFSSIFLGPQIGHQHSLDPNTGKKLEHQPNVKVKHILNYKETIDEKYDIMKVIYIDDTLESHLPFLLFDDHFSKLEEEGVEIIVIGPNDQIVDEDYPENVKIIRSTFQKELDYVLDGLEKAMEKINCKEKVKI